MRRVAQVAVIALGLAAFLVPLYGDLLLYAGLRDAWEYHVVWER